MAKKGKNKPLRFAFDLETHEIQSDVEGVLKTEAYAYVDCNVNYAGEKNELKPFITPDIEEGLQRMLGHGQDCEYWAHNAGYDFSYVQSILERKMGYEQALIGNVEPVITKEQQRIDSIKFEKNFENGMIDSETLDAIGLSFSDVEQLLKRKADIIESWCDCEPQNNPEQLAFVMPLLSVEVCKKLVKWEAKKNKDLFYKDCYLPNKTYSYFIDGMKNFYWACIRNEKGHLVKIKDSFKIVSQSLESASKSFGVQVQKYHMNHETVDTENFINDPEIVKYITNDALSLSLTLTELDKEEMLKKSTAGSNSKAYSDMLFKLEHDEPFDEYCPNQYDLNVPKELDIQERTAHDFCLDSYHGGLTIVNPDFQGVDIRTNGKTFDVNSEYPYVMKERLMPVGNPEFYKTIPTDFDKNTQLALLNVTLDLKVKENRPAYLQGKHCPFRKGTHFITDSNIYYDGKGEFITSGLNIGYLFYLYEKGEFLNWSITLNNVEVYNQDSKEFLELLKDFGEDYKTQISSSEEEKEKWSKLTGLDKECFTLRYSIRYQEFKEYLTSKHGVEGIEDFELNLSTSLNLTLWNFELDMLKECYEIKNFKINSCAVYQGDRDIFKSFVDHWIAEKIKAGKDGNLGKRSVAKIQLNSNYGKHATTADASQRIVEFDENGKAKYKYIHLFKEQKAGYIPIGSIITAYARCYILENILKIGWDKVCYVDTDSIHTIATDQEIKESGLWIDENELGAFKLENEWKQARFVGAKTYLEVNQDKILPTGQKVPSETIIKCCGLSDTGKNLFKLACHDFSQWLEVLEREKIPAYFLDDLTTEQIKFLLSRIPENKRILCCRDYGWPEDIYQDLSENQKRFNERFPEGKKLKLTDFNVCLMLPGKLTKIDAIGGVLLQETWHEIRDNRKRF